MEYMTENIEPTTTAGKMYVDLRNYVDVHFEYFIVYAVNVEFWLNQMHWICVMDVCKLKLI